MYVVQNESLGLVPELPMVVDRRERYYLPVFNTKRAALENILRLDVESKSWWHVVDMEGRKGKTFLDGCTQWWLQNLLRQSPTDTGGGRKRLFWDEKFEMLGFVSIVSLGRMYGEVAMEQRWKQIEEDEHLGWSSE